MSDQAIALAFEKGLPFVGLRDHEHDPDLDRVIPPDAARSARAIPLAAADDHVRLAVADADPDLAALQPYLGDRRVELAIAPREELEELLGPAPATVEGSGGAGVEAESEAVGAEAEALAAEPEAESLAEPPAVEPEPEAEPLAAAPPLAAEPQPEPEAEPLAAEPEPEPEAQALAAEPAPAPAREAQSLAEPPAAEPLAEPEAPAAEPEPAAAEPAAAQLAAEPVAPEPEAAAAPGEDPSWLEPPRKRGWLRAVGRFLLYVLVLAIICGAVAAYLLTR